MGFNMVQPFYVKLDVEVMALKEYSIVPRNEASPSDAVLCHIQGTIFLAGNSYSFVVGYCPQAGLQIMLSFVNTNINIMKMLKVTLY